MKILIISLLISQNIYAGAQALSRPMRSEKKTILVFKDEDVPYFETENIHGKTQLNLVRKSKKNTVQSTKPTPIKEIK